MRLSFFVAFAIVLVGCGKNDGGGDGGTTDASTGAASSSSSESGGSSTGEVPCPDPDRTRCDGICVDLDTDRENCGECGVVLPEDAECFNGEPTCVFQGLEFCEGECVDVLNDDDHCGQCGAKCPNDTNCTGNGCCHVIRNTTEPMTCDEVCLEAGMECACPEYGAASYEGACGLGAVNFEACDASSPAMGTCGEPPDECDCPLARLDCGCTAPAPM